MRGVLYRQPPACGNQHGLAKPKNPSMAEREPRFSYNVSPVFHEESFPPLRGAPFETGPGEVQMTSLVVRKEGVKSRPGTLKKKKLLCEKKRDPRSYIPERGFYDASSVDITTTSRRCMSLHREVSQHPS